MSAEIPRVTGCRPRYSPTLASILEKHIHFPSSIMMRPAEIALASVKQLRSLKSWISSLPS